MRLQNSAGRSYFKCMKYITPSAASMSASPSRQARSVPAGRRSYVRNTSSPTMRIKPIQTTTYRLMVGPRCGAVAVMASAHVHQVDQREDEHPHQVDEMPVQRGRLDVTRIEPPPSESDGDDRDDND